jgi:hypothetical protein
MNLQYIYEQLPTVGLFTARIDSEREENNS